MKRRGFLQRSAALSTIGLPNVSASDDQVLSTDDIDTITNFLSNDRLSHIEPTNPGRGPTNLNNHVGIENVDGESENGFELAKRVLDSNESPCLSNEAMRQSLVQYVGVQEKEMDIKMHYFGVDEDRALLINSFVEDAFPNLDLNIESNDVMNQWFNDDIARLFEINSAEDSLSYKEDFNSVYTDGLPEDRLSVEDRHDSSDRVDVFVFNGSHTHGYGSPGGSAWIEVEPAEDLADEVRNVRTSVHEAGHAVYGLPHHLTVGAMSYNGRMINDFVDNNNTGEFLEFGDYSQPQIERTLNGSIELEETELGHKLVYEAQDRDPEDYTAEFLDNMKQYMQHVTRIALDDLEKRDIEWTGLEAEYTDEMDIARLNVEDYVVELAVHKEDGFKHQDAYAERIR